MDRQALMDEIDQFFGCCSGLAYRKNKDYAKDDDPLCNFRNGAKQVADRIDEKSIRLSNLLGGSDANFESVQDTLMDIANYAAIAYVLLARKENDE